MYALIDCNNFYASCERLFRPALRTRPIIVLSSGDGCVIARSNEAKALGIPMGEPYFKIKALCETHAVAVFSSNFTLYRDMSQRVMSVIESQWDAMEIYSIDEAFLDITSLPVEKHHDFCTQLQRMILKYTGIPVSIGLGASKTLAKLSNHVAKKILKTPVFNIMEHQEWLGKIDVGDVWGVGHKSREKLHAQHIYTADDLARTPPHVLRKRFNVVMLRTSMELQGISCAQIPDPDEPRQTILSSRSFNRTVSSKVMLAQAVSLHCMNVYEKLRAQGSLAGHITVFLQTNRFRFDLPQYTPSMGITLALPTQDIRLLTHHALACLDRIYKSEVEYKKAGVWLTDLKETAYGQLDMFQAQEEKKVPHSAAFLNVLDAINHRYGKRTVRLGTLGFHMPWDTQYAFKSPAYTTRWDEIPSVKNGV